MILTGKSKRVFFKWLRTRVKSKLHEIAKMYFWWSLQDNSFRQSLLIEWFDSVGIYINIRCFSERCFSFITNDACQFIENNRNEAIKKVIIRANEIYNSKN